MEPEIVSISPSARSAAFVARTTTPNRAGHGRSTAGIVQSGNDLLGYLQQLQQQKGRRLPSTSTSPPLRRSHPTDISQQEEQHSSHQQQQYHLNRTPQQQQHHEALLQRSLVAVREAQQTSTQQHETITLLQTENEELIAKLARADRMLQIENRRHDAHAVNSDLTLLVEELQTQVRDMSDEMLRLRRDKEKAERLHLNLSQQFDRLVADAAVAELQGGHDHSITQKLKRALKKAAEDLKHTEQVSAQRAKDLAGMSVAKVKLEQQVLHLRAEERRLMREHDDALQRALGAANDTAAAEANARELKDETVSLQSKLYALELQHKEQHTLLSSMRDKLHSHATDNELSEKATADATRRAAHGETTKENQLRSELAIAREEVAVLRKSKLRAKSELEQAREELLGTKKMLQEESQERRGLELRLKALRFEGEERETDDAASISPQTEKSQQQHHQQQHHQQEIHALVLAELEALLLELEQGILGARQYFKDLFASDAWRDSMQNGLITDEVGDYLSLIVEYVQWSCEKLEERKGARGGQESPNKLTAATEGSSVSPMPTRKILSPTRKW